MASREFLDANKAKFLELKAQLDALNAEPEPEPEPATRPIWTLSLTAEDWVNLRQELVTEKTLRAADVDRLKAEIEAEKQSSAAKQQELQRQLNDVQRQLQTVKAERDQLRDGAFVSDSALPPPPKRLRLHEPEARPVVSIEDDGAQRSPCVQVDPPLLDTPAIQNPVFQTPVFQTTVFQTPAAWTNAVHTLTVQAPLVEPPRQSLPVDPTEGPPPPSKAIEDLRHLKARIQGQTALIAFKDLSPAVQYALQIAIVTAHDGDAWYDKAIKKLSNTEACILRGRSGYQHLTEADTACMACVNRSQYCIRKFGNDIVLCRLNSVDRRQHTPDELSYWILNGERQLSKGAFDTQKRRKERKSNAT